MKSKKPVTASGNAAKIRSGLVVRIACKNLRLNCSQFKDIALKQVYLVEGNQSGSIAARIEILKLSKSKKTAIARVLKFETVTQLNSLVNLKFYRESDFLARQAKSETSTHNEHQ